jgi:hypothetical protein
MIPKTKYEKRKEEILDRISAQDYMWRLQHGMVSRKAAESMVRVSSNSFVIHWPKDSSNVGLHNLSDVSGELCWKGQIVEYVSSNLGRNRGIIWYFICKDCLRRVKYLYCDNYFCAPICRRCCKLPYRQPTRPERKISRYLSRHPEAAQQIISSFIASTGY